MAQLATLVRNETIKIWKKKRFFVIIGILAVIIPIFTYAQLRVAANVQEQLGTDDWKTSLQQEIQGYAERADNPRMLEEWRRWYEVQAQILQYYVDHDINPNDPNGVTFTKQFLQNAVALFIPLIVMVFASDLVSSEHAGGTIKLLLTRPVKRWKVLFSKYVAMTLYVSLTVLLVALLSYAISGAAFGYGGWTAPTLIGFQVTESTVSYEQVRVIDQWQFLLMEAGLVWFSAWVVGAIALMVSVLVRSTAAGMGIMLATLIAGTILAAMASSWESAKYLFMVNLDTVLYLTGDPPPIAGMELGFSLAVLSCTALAAVAVAFRVFTRQDVY